MSATSNRDITHAVPQSGSLPDVRANFDALLVPDEQAWTEGRRSVLLYAE